MSTETKRGPGRPAKSIAYPEGIFTVESLAAANPSACKLTVRKCVKKDLASGVLVTLSRPAKTGTAGRPSVRYSTKASYDARLAANIAKSAVTPTPEPAPEVTA